MALEARLTAIEGRLSLVEDRATVLETDMDVRAAEELRSRGRLHKLEATEQALVLAAEAVKMLAERSGLALDNIESIAEQAATKAIIKDREDRNLRLRKTWVFRAAVVGGFSGGLYAIAEILFHFVH